MRAGLAFLILFITAVVAVSSCPTIITRDGWGARPATRRTNLRRPVPFVLIHHSAGNNCDNLSKCTSTVRNIQAYHMDSRRWSDIGYNFLIGGDGSVFEGRGWTRQGSHEPKYNANGLGICFLGNFQGEAPTAAAIESAKRLIDCGVSTNMISNNYKLIGHRQAKSTECPGNNLYNLIKKWKNWTPNP
ncbi:peptidoglycan-recognition protein SC2-like [Cloeon dipterum]|uniref:peptidoglycan-recognition protein SC2-like n=1 Tax=Cloeon dipterum TaxID=197152 RepID=UPI003220315B